MTKEKIGFGERSAQEFNPPPREKYRVGFGETRKKSEEESPEKESPRIPGFGRGLEYRQPPEHTPKDEPRSFLHDVFPETINLDEDMQEYI